MNETTTQSTTRWHLLPIVLVFTGVLTVWITAFAASKTLGPLQWVFYGAGLAALAGAWGFRHRVNAAAAQLEADQEILTKKKEELKAEQDRMTGLKKEVDQEIEKRTLVLQKKEAELSRKLMTFHEWMEFPRGIDDGEAAFENISFTALHQQDRKAQELIRKRTEAIFEKIRRQEYRKNGDIQREAIVRDVLELTESVARIYNPNSRNPLLETSLEQLLRAVNRVALQLLVLLEQFPIDFKSYNIQTIYETVQTGVKAYNVYKTAVPYWTFLRPAYYLGRFTLGSNPLVLGAWWAMGELAKGGAKKLSSHLVSRYALSLLYDTMFIIGGEAAGIFGGDFRHRDPNWIYGAELTELIRRHPLNQEILQNGLKEVGHLQLRCEYDRIFLYHCLAAHKSAGPDRFNSRPFLTDPERRTIAERLERFLEQYLKTEDDTLQSWKAETEERLGVKVLSDARTDTRSTQEKAEDGLRSLAGFLLDIKRRRVEDLPELLTRTRMISHLEEEARRDRILDFMAEPPMIFDYPDLEPSDSLLDDYLHDLIELGVRVFPHDRPGEDVVEGTALYFRVKDLAAFRKKIDRMYTDVVEKTLRADSPEKRIKPEVIRRILAVLGPDESLRFVYRQPRIEDSGAAEAPWYEFGKPDLWLLGTDARVLVLRISKTEGAEPALVWEGKAEGDEAVSAEYADTRFGGECRLRGGRWLSAAEEKKPEPPKLVLSGPTLGRRESYFKPLMDFCSGFAPGNRDSSRGKA
ncbi:MAG: hypothetical protein ACLFQY_17960 [Desulfococcaceae bacterium]